MERNLTNWEIDTRIFKLIGLPESKKHIAAFCCKFVRWRSPFIFTLQKFLICGI